MVHGSWFMVHGSWFMVHGSWFMVSKPRKVIQLFLNAFAMNYEP
jgi:hypothetical protein